MDSTIPCVSSVAWTSFLTGVEPLDHGIMGFVDRDPKTMQWYLPTADQLKKPTLLDILSDRGRQVFCMNVPMTYPPKKVNGILISGFLAPSLEKATYPAHLSKVLKAKGYQIDADVELAKTDLRQFIYSLEKIMMKRFEIAMEYVTKRPWDLFMFHIMETDRLHHFTWKFMEEGQNEFAELFFSLYEKLDEQLGFFIDKINKDMGIMLLSDHGFTQLKREVQVNRVLVDAGYLKFKNNNPKDLSDLNYNTLAYSLYPGRIYINLKSRESIGTVNPGMEYERLRAELKQVFLELKDPMTGKNIVKEVVSPEELIVSKGERPFLPERDLARIRLFAPDLFIVANEGFDLKSNLWHPKVFENTIHNGMHTHNDAFLMVKNCELTNGRFSISDVVPLIFSILGEDIPTSFSRRMQSSRYFGC